VRSHARLDENNATDEDTRDSVRSRARSDDGNTTDDDTQDRVCLRARSDDSTKRQKRDRGSIPDEVAQHEGVVHPLASSPYRAASADTVW
jgi:hypothetical protein